MKAIVVGTREEGFPLRIAEVDAPLAGAGEVRIAVRATAVNRADLLQRRGLYPPPPDASPILGLECAGIVESVGPGVERVRPGERVMALLSGGGYAELAVAHAGSILPIPPGMSELEAAAFPETFFTAFLNLFLLGGLRKGKSALVHGGGSGVGTAAIQLCRVEGIDVVVTAGSDEKCARCLSLGAAAAVNYREKAFEDEVLRWSGGRGVDVILDPIGASYLAPNLRALAPEGRLIVIGAMGGSRGELDLARLLSRRLQVIGSTLRGRSSEAKREIVEAFVHRFGAALRRGELRPVIDSTFPLGEADQAHRNVESSLHFGKVVLVVTED